MNCPICASDLFGTYGECPHCGYAKSDDLPNLPDAPGTRPQAVVLATKFLAAALGFNVLMFLIALLRLGQWRIMINRGLWVAFCIWALNAVFIALIWHGVSWARKMFLMVVGCLAAFTIWKILFAISAGHVFGFFSGLFSGFSWVNLSIDLYAGYLLIQPESIQWFDR